MFRPDELPREIAEGSLTLTEVLGSGGMAVVYRADVDVERFDLAALIASGQTPPGRQREREMRRALLLKRWSDRTREEQLAEIKRLGLNWPSAGYAAVKVLSASIASKPDACERFEREWRSLIEIHHPGVMPVYAGGVDAPSGLPYYAMALIEDPLELAATAALPRDTLLELAAQAADGLAALHERALIHRDIKPQNILITGAPAAPRAIVADLGIAKDAGATTGMTRTGAIFGTPHFLAPEQLGGAARSDVRSDVYALGATLYAWIAGHPPYWGISELEVMGKLYSREPARPLTDLDERVPAPVAELVAAMMSLEPEDRPESMAEVAAELRALIGDADSGKRSRKRRRRPSAVEGAPSRPTRQQLEPAAAIEAEPALEDFELATLAEVAPEAPPARVVCEAREVPIEEALAELDAAEEHTPEAMQTTTSRAIEPPAAARPTTGRRPRRHTGTRRSRSSRVAPRPAGAGDRKLWIAAVLGGALLLGLGLSLLIAGPSEPPADPLAAIAALPEGERQPALRALIEGGTLTAAQTERARAMVASSPSSAPARDVTPAGLAAALADQDITLATRLLDGAALSGDRRESIADDIRQRARALWPARRRSLLQSVTEGRSPDAELARLRRWRRWLSEPQRDELAHVEALATDRAAAEATARSVKQALASSQRSLAAPGRGLALAAAAMRRVLSQPRLRLWIDALDSDPRVLEIQAAIAIVTARRAALRRAVREGGSLPVRDPASGETHLVRVLELDDYQLKAVDSAGRKHDRQFATQPWSLQLSWFEERIDGHRERLLSGVAMLLVGEPELAGRAFERVAGSPSAPQLERYLAARRISAATLPERPHWLEPHVTGPTTTRTENPLTDTALSAEEQRRPAAAARGLLLLDGAELTAADFAIALEMRKPVPTTGWSPSHMAADPRDRWLAAAHGRRVVIARRASGELGYVQLTIKHTISALLPLNGRLVVAGAAAGSGTRHQLMLAHGAKLRPLVGCGAPVIDAALDASGRRLVVLASDGNVVSIELEQKNPRAPSAQLTSRPTSLAWCRSLGYLVGGAGVKLMWCPHPGIANWKTREDHVTHQVEAMHRDGRDWIVTLDPAGTLIALRIERDGAITPVVRLQGFGPGARMAIHPSGLLLAVTTQTGSLALVGTGKGWPLLHKQAIPGQRPGQAAFVAWGWRSLHLGTNNKTLLELRAKRP